jgi:ABC-type multidrug transport system fused ATPase/permease subunit
MKKGECIESGTQQELLDKRGEFFRLRTLQV